MSDNEGTKAKSGWTDKERLTYLFALIENSNVKFDYNATPRPAGRTVIACQRMMERLKGALRDELDALQTGRPIDGGTPKKSTPKSAGRKRKVKDVDGDEMSATPTKRGRKKNATPEVENETMVKNEPEGDVELPVEEEVEV